MFRAQHRAVNRKTFAIRLTGIFLLAASGLAAFGWFVWLAPVRHLSDFAWLDKHTPKQTWTELQRELKHHAYYSHESGSFLELWGDKEAAGWLIEEFKAGRTHDGCDDGHLDMALPFITNQELGYETNAWIAWWGTNSQKTQEEWIRDGFAKRGINLTRQLTTNNTITLLKLLDRQTTNIVNAAGSNKISASLRYNSFRWLRDAGVETRNVDFASLPESEKNSVARGLIVYGNDLGAFANHPGRIFKAAAQYPRTSWILSWYFQLGLAVLLASIAFGGWKMLRCR
jgi:hypothetical protein